MDLVDEIRQYSQQPLTHQLLVSLLKTYKRPNDKIHKLLRDELITPIKKGLYIAGPRLNAPKPEPLLVANHILGPSYVSLETALAHYGYIPERVYEIASMTTKASRQFKTPIGTFTYARISLPYYSFGIQHVKLSNEQFVMMASPLKAICDKVIITSGLLLRSKRSAYEFLVENMRMETDKLKELNTVEMATWISFAPKQQSIQMVLNALRDLC